MLLDFDGPVTPLFADGRSAKIADAVRHVVVAHTPDLGAGLRATTDPFEFLRAVGSPLPEDLEFPIDEALAYGELEAARVAPLADGVTELLAACRSTGRLVIITSNNSALAIRAFLYRHGLEVDGIVGRLEDRPRAIKPSPEIVERALTVGGAAPLDAFLYGDSVSDIDAGRAAGVATVGFGKNPRRAAELRSAHAGMVVTSTIELVSALRHR